MNIKRTFLAAIVGTTITVITAQAENTQKAQTIENQPQWKEWCVSYVTPCIAGGLVGSITGKMSACIIRGTLGMMATTPIFTKNEAVLGTVYLAGLATIISTLIAENKLRTKCVDSVNRSFENYNINHNNLADNSAWLMSWYKFLK